MMHSETVLEILENWPTHTVQLLVDELNRTGIITDEDHGSLSAYMVKGWDEDCTHFIKSRGYTGGNIQHGGAYTNCRECLCTFR